MSVHPSHRTTESDKPFFPLEFPLSSKGIERSSESAMESTALMTARLPLPTSGSRSKPLSPASFTRAARRLASVPFSSGSGSGSVVLLSCRSRDYAGVGSLVSAAAASGDTADAGSESILLSVQVNIPLSIESLVEFETLFPVVSSSRIDCSISMVG